MYLRISPVFSCSSRAGIVRLQFGVTGILELRSLCWCSHLLTAANVSSDLLRWGRGLAGCAVQMPDVIEKTGTASLQKCAEDKGSGHKF